MIIRISDLRPEETIEIRVNNRSILRRTTEPVEIRIENVGKGCSSTSPHRPGRGPRHKRAISF